MPASNWPWAEYLAGIACAARAAPDHDETKRLVKGYVDCQVSLQIGCSRQFVHAPAAT